MLCGLFYVGLYCFLLKAKVAVQADIDCIAELADFLRFNSYYAQV